MSTTSPRSPSPTATPPSSPSLNSTSSSSPSPPSTPPPTPPPMTPEVQQILQDLFDMKLGSIETARNFIFLHPEFTRMIKPTADFIERNYIRGLIVLGEQEEEEE